ncbi:MAG TPA: hypothetical protein VEW07_05600 [Solirubrobacterales bacterium]|nr:hypothetical protein [Solirubrobacterales bacterium]
MLPKLDTLAVRGGKKADEFADRVGGAFNRLTGIATTAMDTLGFNVSQMLKALGGKVPPINLKNALGSLPELKPMGNQLAPVGRQTGGLVPAFATGGLAGVVPGNSTGDRHTLSLNGTPVAKVESKEGIFVGNRNLMGAMQRANDAVPRFQKGGLVDGAVQRLRRGGLVEPKLAGAGGALKEMGQSAIHKVFEGAKDYLARQRSMGPAGGELGSAPGALGAVEKLASKMGLQMTSGFRPGDDGFHGINRARDFSNSTGPTPEMMQFALAVSQRWGKRLLELIYSPLGWSIDNGIKTPPFAVPEHFNHVHVAMQKGGLLLQKLARGGSLAAWDALSGSTWDNDELATLAHVTHMASPGRMAQKSQGESSGNRKAVGNDPGGTEGLGLWQITTGYNDDKIAKHGGREAMFHPYQNALAGKEILDDQGMGAWYAPFVGPVGRVNSALAERMRGIVSGKSAEVGTAGGAEAKPNEDIPGSYKGVKAGDQVNLGPMPKNLEGVKAAIAKWQPEAGKYRRAKAHAEKNGKPDVAQAIGRNLAAIEQRLVALGQQQTRLRLKEVRNKLKKRVSRATGRFAAYQQEIEGKERDYNIGYQEAEQLVELEPQLEEFPANWTDQQKEGAEKAHVQRLTDYVNLQERPAFEGLLGKAADWRNTILRAETFGLGENRPSVQTTSTNWEANIFNARSRISQINDFTKEVGQKVAGWRQNHKGEPQPSWLTSLVQFRDKMREQLPALQLRDSSLTEALTEARGYFYPGGPGRIKPPDRPLPGSGSLEQSLETVQGIHRFPNLHELLDTLPATRTAGRFGGLIWDLQGTIEGLGLKIRQATNSLGGPTQSDDSESAELWKQIALEANQRNLLRGIEERVFANMPKPGGLQLGGALPFAGTFHGGGVTPGPRTQESLALMQGRETIFNEAQTAALGGMLREPTSHQVTVNVHEGGEVDVEIDDRKVEAIVNRMGRRGARGASRGLAAPGVFAK